MGHIQFCLRVFRLQRARGAYFLMEHPESADSWQIPEVEEFLKSEGVMLSVADQCMYGLVTPFSVTGEPTPAKKPTRFMSNSWCILHELSTRCDEGHTHQHLVGGRASKAQEYPDKLCRAIGRGLANQKRYDEAGVVCTGGLSLNSLKAFANVNVRRDNCIVKPDGNVIIPDRPILDPWRQPGNKQKKTLISGWIASMNQMEHRMDIFTQEMTRTAKLVNYTRALMLERNSCNWS